jgi:ribosomal protein S27AE
MDYLGALLIVVFLVLLSFRGSFRSTSLKPQTNLRCSRCGRVTTHTTHTDRTLDASNSGETKLFCGRCHGHWLQSQPLNPGGVASTTNKPGASAPWS